jgi:hypothetical protein
MLAARASKAPMKRLMAGQTCILRGNLPLAAVWQKSWTGVWL